ncbi:MAG TPA: O-antigen ligase family protein [Candidatus Methylomirabilis sp.]|nr:O-antigen ligase family protein [Candidatus Methylomirabilis sp.]
MNSFSMAVKQSTAGIGTLGWGVVLLLIAAAVLIAAGVPFAPAWIVSGTVAVLFAYTYPYVTHGIVVALVPFLGIMVSLPTGKLAIGERAFGGAIDVQVGELAAMSLVVAWAFKVFFLWVKRRDVNWKPWLPFALPMAAVVATHLASAFSAFQPDPILVAKYTLRPVFWAYLIYVVITVNFVRSRRRLLTILGIVAATGVFAALMGSASLAFAGSADQFLRRAHPLPMFGIMPLGDNHNLLAEWFAVTVPLTIALALLVQEKRSRRLLMLAAGFQAVVALLTFARTLWIVLAFEAILAGWLVWRDELRQWFPRVLVAIVFLIPLAFAMTVFSGTALVRSSTSTRYMLSEIALNLWQASPWIGVGAGTFVDRIANIRVFIIEYGNPVDAHGFGQKLIAEVGLLGLLAVAWVVAWVYGFVRYCLGAFKDRPRERDVFLILAIAASGSFLYQLFNTNYWTGKLWLPVGILLAAARILHPNTGLLFRVPRRSLSRTEPMDSE